jgi:type III secretion system YscQ/HrcQ family protein
MSVVITDDLRQLSLHVACGRHNPESSLTLRWEQIAAPTLAWRNINGKGLILCDEQAWLEWLEPVAPARSVSALPSALQDAMTDWGFTQCRQMLHRCRFLPARVEQCIQPLTEGFVVTLRRESQTLSLLLMDWDWQLLQQTTADWPSMHLPGQSMKMPLSLIIGCTSLSLADLRVLAIGDAIRLMRHCDFQSDKVWLCGLPSPRTVVLTENNHLILSDEATDHVGSRLYNELISMNQPSITDIPLEVRVEIGKIVLSIAELDKLQPGDIFTQIATLHDQLQLTVNGVLVGYGSLIQAVDGWAVRIESRYDVPAIEGKCQ